MVDATLHFKEVDRHFEILDNIILCYMLSNKIDFTCFYEDLLDNICSIITNNVALHYILESCEIHKNLKGLKLKCGIPITKVIQIFRSNFKLFKNNEITKMDQSIFIHHLINQLFDYYLINI